MLAPGIFVILPFILLQGKHLEVIELGDEEAIGLGVPLRKKQIFFLCCAIILAAISVSVAGSISFIGLIAPHIAKEILQRKNNQAILMTAMIGTLILLYIVAKWRNGCWHHCFDHRGSLLYFSAIKKISTIKRSCFLARLFFCLFFEKNQ